MLGLKDDKDDSCCDYEPRPVITKKKLQKENHGHLSPGTKKNVRLKNIHIPMQELNPLDKDVSEAHDGNHQNNLSMEEENVKNEKQMEEKIDQENSVTFYNSSEQNENSKAFIESLGSWINDLFNVPNKNASAPPETQKNDQRDSVLEKDPEYLKSISSIKAQFRKKLKSETSIQVSAPDKPFVFNFDKDFDEKKLKKSTRSLPTTPTDWLEELVEEEQYTETHPAGLVIRRSEHVNLRPCKSRNNLHLNGSILVKEKKKTKVKNRQDISELEEYVFPTPSELSKRILLNVNESEKCGQLYKNPQSLGMQEAQHYGQRKSRSRQTITRCYTTKANPADTPTNSKQASDGLFHYCTTSATAVRGSEGFLRRNPVDIKKYQNRRHSKKELADISRDSISLLRMNSQKPAPNLTMEAVKGDVKTSSDDLVKYLMKKIKNTRPQQPRSKTTVNVPQLLSTPKTKFMQSATKTLVSVMAKKENENQSSTKSTGGNTNKELILKNSDANIRLDVSRAIAANKYSRLSYLLEDNRIEDDGYLFEKDYKNSKRSTEEMQKHGLRKNSNKFHKRQEVKNMLSKIDTRFNILETKSKQRDRKKKIEESENTYMKEEQNPRFQKQHELFKTNLKMMQQNTNAESQEVQNEVEDCQNDLPVATELAVIDKTPQEEDLSDLQEKTFPTEPSNAVLEEKNFIVAPTEPENEEYETLESDSQKPEKKAAENCVVYREKIIKPKSLQFFKDPDSRMMLGPLEKLCITEQNQKDSSKGNESPLNTPEVGQVKNTDMMILNRRLATNMLNEPGLKSKAPPWTQPVKSTLFLDDLGTDTNGDKKEAKDKKKVKTPKASIVKESNGADNCGFDKSKKKPGPNCEKDE